MSTDISSLQSVYSGWDTYQTSIVHTISQLSPEQLAWRPAPHLRSAGEIASHIADGRIYWFHRFMGEGNTELASLVASGVPEDTITTNASELIKGLEISWQLEHARNWHATDHHDPDRSRGNVVAPSSRCPEACPDDDFAATYFATGEGKDA